VIKERKSIIEKPFFIAGGLDPGNVRDAVRETGAFGVDVSSGVESAPGRKDKILVKEFVENAKKA
jgi:phosphoribosylanthranilate isomerase